MQTYYDIEATRYPDRADVEHLMRVLSEVADERQRQDEKWGGPEHDNGHAPADWMDFIDLKLDEAELAANQGNVREVRRVMVQIAALAVAGVQALDRREGRA